MNLSFIEENGLRPVEGSSDMLGACLRLPTMREYPLTLLLLLLLPPPPILVPEPRRSLDEVRGAVDEEIGAATLREACDELDTGAE